MFNLIFFFVDKIGLFLNLTENQYKYLSLYECNVAEQIFSFLRINPSASCFHFSAYINYDETRTILPDIDMNIKERLSCICIQHFSL